MLKLRDKLQRSERWRSSSWLQQQVSDHKIADSMPVLGIINRRKRYLMLIS